LNVILAHRVANRTKEGVGTYLYPHIYYRWRSQNIVYIQPQLDMSVGEFKLAQIQLSRIYLMELRYIQSMVGDTVLKPDETRINSVGQIYPTWVGYVRPGLCAKPLKPNEDRIYPTGQICLTWAGCQAFGIQ
jgi:hypothetical protein